MTTYEQLRKEIHHDAVWNARLGLCYHARLKGFYARLCRYATIAFFTLSLAALSVFDRQDASLTLWLFSIALALQIMKAVLDIENKAALHAWLEQRYLNLATELGGLSTMPDDRVTEFYQKRLAIEKDEPTILGCVLDGCHNHLIKRHHYNTCHLVNMTPWDKFKVWMLR